MTTSLNSSRPVLDQDARSGQSRLATLTASTTITQESHDGKALLMGAAGAALTFTLPAALGTGAKYRFVNSVVNTSNYVIKVANATDIMAGSILSTQDGGDTVVGWETAADSDTITLNGTTTGGVNIGDWIELQDIKAGFFSVTGMMVSSGTEATPFSATV